MNYILQMLWNTPWWVYVVFYVLIKQGVQSTKMRILSIYKMAILPIIILLLSLQSLFTQISFATLGVWFFAIILGVAVGWKMVMRLNLRVDQDHKLIQIPGSWTTLIVSMIIFSTKYFFGYSLSTEPELVNSFPFMASMLGISGVCSGLFIGRFLCYFVRLKKGPHTSLVLTT